MLIRLKDSRKIPASAEAIEQLLLDFSQWPELFEKVHSTEAHGDSAQGVIRFQRKTHKFYASVLEHQPAKMIYFKMDLTELEGGGPGPGNANLRYEFKKLAPNSTKVFELTEFREPVPWWLGFLIIFFHKFGKPVGDSVLERVEKKLL